MVDFCGDKRLALRVHYDANNRDLFFGSGTIF